MNFNVSNEEAWKLVRAGDTVYYMDGLPVWAIPRKKTGEEILKDYLMEL